MTRIEQTSVDNILTISDEPRRGIFIRPEVGFIRSTNNLSETEYRKITIFKALDYQVAIVNKGSIKVECNMQPLTLNTGDILVCCPATLVCTKSRTSDYDTTVISLHADAVSGIPSFGYKILKTNGSEIPSYYVSIIESLLNEYKSTGAAILAVQSFIVYLVESKEEETIRDQRIDRRSEIFNSFVNLLNEKGLSHHISGYYAEKLNVSLNYLNDIVKGKSGRTVYQWINDYLITEAKAILLHTTNNVQQVSDILNFPNSAFFCKFFKTHTGLTPTQFKKYK
ncbi:MAG: AraC family transcriptional regulator [Bacteroides sp.]|nr:AraC family transcriptional regulator [Bacteroides sp.]